MDDSVSFLSLLVSHGSYVTLSAVWMIYTRDLEGLPFAQAAQKDVNKTLQSLQFLLFYFPRVLGQVSFLVLAGIVVLCASSPAASYAVALHHAA